MKIISYSFDRVRGLTFVPKSEKHWKTEFAMFVAMKGKSMVWVREGKKDKLMKVSMVEAK